jgi:hypothetical protein
MPARVEAPENKAKSKAKGKAEAAVPPKAEVPIIYPIVPCSPNGELSFSKTHLMAIMSQAVGSYPLSPSIDGPPASRRKSKKKTSSSTNVERKAAGAKKTGRKIHWSSDTTFETEKPSIPKEATSQSIGSNKERITKRALLGAY